jgi:hypothetical protein
MAQRSRWWLVSAGLARGVAGAPPVGAQATGPEFRVKHLDVTFADSFPGG